MLIGEYWNVGEVEREREGKGNAFEKLTNTKQVGTCETSPHNSLTKCRKPNSAPVVHNSLTGTNVLS